MKILVTGGLGYIGSHTCVALLACGYDVVILDDLSNSSTEVLNRLDKITGQRPPFIDASVLDHDRLKCTLEQHGISAVIHFAAFKAVAESVAQPLKYYENNVGGTISLLNCMTELDIKTLVFSSSATVYGTPAAFPIREDFPRFALNPYGRSKIIVEDLLTDIVASDPSWRVANLRYFNPVGAHQSGLIGEHPKGVPNNLMPYLLQVAIGRRPVLEIFGTDYPTKDGSCVRDFIHVVDLAEAHVAALDYLQQQQGLLTVNLGTGRGISVLEMCQAFETTTGQVINRKIVGRRPGDVAECWSDPSLANARLHWHAKRDLTAMCRDAWAWQTQNPNGYDGA
jgi:UDP-glucose 4-epimerase